MIALPILASAALAALLAITISNVRRFPRLQVPLASDADNSLPCVSVLIPARNEAAVIGATVQLLDAQAYAQRELLVLDDNSEDGTAALAQQAAARECGVRVLAGAPLPGGWMGKNWACDQLARHAHGEILLFTDADVRWQPGALAAVVDLLERTDADLLTVWPTQITVSWGERLTVPLIAMTVLAYLPVQLAHDFYHPLAAAANGQCMAFRRAAYAATGGHAAVRGEIVEDVRLAQRVKAAGLKLRMADGAGLVTCRMYGGSKAAIDGLAKSVLAGHGNRSLLLILSTSAHLLLFLWPWLWLAAGRGWALPGWPLWPLALVTAGIGLRGLTAHASGQRVGDALLMPVSALLMTWITVQALWWRVRYGGVRWKGRVVRAN